MSQCQKCKAMVNQKWTECLVCGCAVAGGPMPTERKASFDVDGGQDKPNTGPVDVVMDSPIIGTVPVALSPNQAVVDGVIYSKAELADLLSRSLTTSEIERIHETKRSFDGKILPSNQMQ